MEQCESSAIDFASVSKHYSPEWQQPLGRALHSRAQGMPGAGAMGRGILRGSFLGLLPGSSNLLFKCQ